MTRNKGFTIIELMAVVSILSILAIIALSAYSDFIVRSKVAEALGFAAEAKTSVSAYWSDQHTFPQTNAQAGLPDPDSYNRYDYMSKLELSSTAPFGVINITFKIVGSDADGKVLQLIPSTSDGVVSWQCIPPAVNGIDVSQVPPNCRG